MVFFCLLSCFCFARVGVKGNGTLLLFELFFLPCHITAVTTTCFSYVATQQYFLLLGDYYFTNTEDKHDFFLNMLLSPLWNTYCLIITHIKLSNKLKLSSAPSNAMVMSSPEVICLAGILHLHLQLPLEAMMEAFSLLSLWPWRCTQKHRGTFWLLLFASNSALALNDSWENPHTFPSPASYTALHRSMNATGHAGTEAELYTVPTCHHSKCVHLHPCNSCPVCN